MEVVFKTFKCKYNIDRNISEFILSKLTQCAQAGPLSWTARTPALGIESQFILFRAFTKVSTTDLNVFYKGVVRVKLVLVLDPEGQGNLIE